MTIQDLLARAERLGIHLWLEGERARFRAPDTPQARRLIEELRRRRAEVIAALRQDPWGDRDYVRVPLADLCAFLERHGLEVVGGGWPDGEERPILRVRRNGHERP